MLEIRANKEKVLQLDFTPLILTVHSKIFWSLWNLSLQGSLSLIRISIYLSVSLYIYEGQKNVSWFLVFSYRQELELCLRLV